MKPTTSRVFRFPPSSASSVTDGASAIYGSDAVGGVINIIQRKNYNGTEVSASYENTFDTNTAVSTIGAAHSFVVGKLSASVNGNYQHRNAFAATDRYFTATTDWTKLGGTNPLPVYFRAASRSARASWNPPPATIFPAGIVLMR